MRCFWTFRGLGSRNSEAPLLNQPLEVEVVLRIQGSGSPRPVAAESLNEEGSYPFVNSCHRSSLASQTGACTSPRFPFGILASKAVLVGDLQEKLRKSEEAQMISVFIIGLGTLGYIPP